MLAAKLDHDKTVAKVREGFEAQVAALQGEYDNKMRALREELELQRQQEVHDMEDAKNVHIQELVAQHEKVSCFPFSLSS